MKQPDTRVQVYVVKVTLLGTSPPVWRRILVPRDVTLRNLHGSLQTVMGWTNSHLHQFVLQKQGFPGSISRIKTKVANENRTRLGDLIWNKGARLLYEYDFGDAWQHELLLEEILLGEESFQQICVAGDRCCPPEDCGGPQGFAEFLQALQDPSHSSHEEVVEWIGAFVPQSSLWTRLIGDCAAGSVDPDQGQRAVFGNYRRNRWNFPHRKIMAEYAQ